MINKYEMHMKWHLVDPSGFWSLCCFGFCLSKNNELNICLIMVFLMFRSHKMAWCKQTQKLKITINLSALLPVLQMTVPGNQNSVTLQPLLSDSEYRVSLTAIYANGEGPAITRSARTCTCLITLELWVMQHIQIVPKA